MVANSSKLARKSYYKELQQNQFEREFCVIMDPKVLVYDKIKVIYKVYISLVENRSQDTKQGKEFFSFLKQEVDQNEQSIMFLKNEIEYFMDQLSINYQSNSQISKKNTFLLEKGPLPSIKESMDGETLQINMEET